MINQSVLVGRIARDLVLRYTPSGTAVLNFTVACNKPKKDGQEQEADFLNCVTFGKQAENLANFQKKGSLIGITGRNQSRSYEGQDGKRVYVQEIVAERVQFLEFSGNGEGNTNTPRDNYNRAAEQNSNYTRVDDDPYNSGETIDIKDDDLPF